MGLIMYDCSRMTVVWVRPFFGPGSMIHMENAFWSKIHDMFRK